MMLSQTELDRINQQIAQKLTNMDAIHAKYDGDKRRFLELKPRETALKSINQQKKSLAELFAWKSEAEDRYGYYQRQMIQEKRSGQSVSDDLLRKLQNTQEEIKRVDQQIAQAQSNIKDTEKSFSGSRNESSK